MTTGLDVSGFARVIEIDPEARSADVLGATTYGIWSTPRLLTGWCHSSFRS